MIRVAPDGAVARRGRFGSLAKAIDHVAALRRRGRTAPIVVALDSGTHRVARVVRIGPDHAGDIGAGLTLRGASDGSTRLVGSVILKSIPVPATLRAHAPEVARGALRAFLLPEDLRRERDFREPRRLHETPRIIGIFDRKGALRPAQWPNEGYAAAKPEGATTFAFRVGAPALSVAEPELWAEGFWAWNWLNETLPVRRVELGTGRFTLDEIPYDGIRDGARVRLVHALSQLDEPGEWWRDRASGVLLAWPSDDEPALEASLADSLIIADGARHLRLENLRLERSRGDLVVVRGGEDVVIRHSDLSWAAGRAATFEGVAGGGIEHCSIHDVGASGVRLVGGERASLVSGGLLVRDSRFTRFASSSVTQSAAVEVDGVGAQIVGNYVYDAVGYAVFLKGNDHLFSNNEVARLMRGLSDSGAIYAGRDWTARGTVIRDNYVHDIEPAPGLEVKGVYLDDMASGFTVERNLFVNVQKPVFIGGGSDNTVSGNVFVSSSPAISLDSRGETWMAEAVMDPGSEIRAAYAAMPVGSARWRERYPRLDGLLSHEPKVARDNRIVGNTYVNSRPLFTEQEGDPRRQVMLQNSDVTLPDPSRDPTVLFRQLEERGLSTSLKLQTMRRDMLPESPFGAP